MDLDTQETERMHFFKDNVIFIKIDNVLDLKRSLRASNILYIQTVFCNHNAIKLKSSNKRRSFKHL